MSRPRTPIGTFGAIGFDALPQGRWRGHAHAGWRRCRRPGGQVTFVDGAYDALTRSGSTW